MNRSLWKNLAAAGLTTPLGGCSILKTSFVNHAGVIAEQEWRLWMIVCGVLVLVAGPVLLLTPLMAWHYRLSNRRHAYRPNWKFSWPLEGFIWIPPIAVVIGLGGLIWRYTSELDPYRPIASDQPVVEVQAVAFDWKWLFIYPDQRLATVNHLAIPVGRPVHITLTSGTVMQSMLIPRLAGQIYAMPGMKTQLNLAAAKPGRFLGENTQFNGAGFAHQKFTVEALPPAEYERWLANTKSRAPRFTDATLARLFARTIVPRPLAFAEVPDAAFARIMARSTGGPRN